MHLLDLKPDNIGFAADGSIKLFDFGLCTCVRTRGSLGQSYAMTGNTGSLRYMAPEVAREEPYTEKVDVYSYSIILWQMAKDKVPYSGMSKSDFMKKVVYGGQRPKIDKSWPLPFADMLRACWSDKHTHRPSFKVIVETLDELLSEGSTISNSRATTAVSTVSAVSATASNTITGRLHSLSPSPSPSLLGLGSPSSYRKDGVAGGGSN